MTLHVLDTDHLSLFQRGHASVVWRVATIPADQIAIAVITAEEQFRGRLAQISRASTAAERSAAYDYLTRTIRDLAKFNILRFDVQADAIFQNLKSQRIRIGTQDLRIAAVALAARGVLVTRNKVDFSLIPELSIEDWSR